MRLFAYHEMIQKLRILFQLKILRGEPHLVQTLL